MPHSQDKAEKKPSATIAGDRQNNSYPIDTAVDYIPGCLGRSPAGRRESKRSDAQEVKEADTESYATKLWREVYTVGPAVGKGMWDAAIAESNANELLTVAGSAALGWGLAACERRLGPLGLGVSVFGWSSAQAFIRDGIGEFQAVMPALKDIWSSDKHLDSDRKEIANRLGRFSLDFVMSTAGGAAGAAFGRSSYPQIDYKMLPQSEVGVRLAAGRDLLQLEKLSGMDDFEWDPSYVIDYPKRGIVGMIGLDYQYREIGSFFVDPAYRRYSMKLLKVALDNAAKVGGRWGAHCRESTSYKILSALGKRGTVEIVSDTLDGAWHGDGEPMHWVEFEFPKKGQKFVFPGLGKMKTAALAGTKAV